MTLCVRLTRRLIIGRRRCSSKSRIGGTDSACMSANMSMPFSKLVAELGIADEVKC
jgi:hypothetical protein